MGPGVWENDRGGAIRVLQAFRQPKNSSTLHLLHPRCCDRSLRGKRLAWPHQAAAHHNSNVKC